MKPKLTPWFDGSVKPVRPGVYERDYGGLTAYCQWNGLSFGFGYESAAKASRELHHVSSSLRNVPWRGLAQDPKGTK